jgi:DNA repair exonuclease SbcCD ATPase subunit
MTPELAARAVTDYLLPLFEKDTRSATSKIRRRVFNQRLEALPGTVYGELKLSEQLNKQLEEMRAEVRLYKQKMQDAVQARESTLSEFSALQREFIRAKSDYQLINSQYSNEQQLHQALELKVSVAYTQLAEYKALYLQCETDKKQLSSMLHEEKALNDKLKNKATELEHGYSLLNMENDIIGERLKGLYEAVFHLSDRKGTEDKLTTEVSLMAAMCRDVTGQISSTLTKVGESLYDRDQIRADFTEMSRLRLETKEERDRIAAAAKEQIALLNARCDKASDELEAEKLEAVKLQKQFEDLIEEHEKLRQKMKQNRLKRKQYGEMEEKICMKCQKIFQDSENFNWSCRTHKSEYSNEMWWCCGKTSRDAAGCIVSKHQSKEDEEDEVDILAKEENEKMAIAGMRCPVSFT